MISGKDSRAPSGLCGVRQAEDVVHHIYERELGLIVQMAVDVRRGADVAVAQPFLDLLHGHVVGQQQRSAAVPEIVKTDMPQAVLVKQLWKRGGEIVRRNEHSHLVHTDVVQIPLVIAPAAYAPVFFLLFFVR